MSALISKLEPSPPSIAAALDSQFEKGTKFSFQCLLWFGLIVFIAPQYFFPILVTIGIGKVVMFLVLLSYAKFAFSCGKVNFAMGSELTILICFLLLSLLSAGFSNWPGGSIQFFLEYSIKDGVVFFLVANLVNSRERAKNLCWTF